MVSLTDPATCWHAYNGLKLPEFAKLANIPERQVENLISSRWFRRDGSQPELLDVPGHAFSFSPAAAARYVSEAPIRSQRASRERSRSKWEAGVYVVRTEEGPRRYKIGFASCVEKRASGLRGMSPVALSLVAFVPGKDIRFEYRLHKAFRRGRLHGEWFEESLTLLWFIDHHRWEGPQP